MYGGRHKVTNVREDSSQDYTLRELLLCRVTEEGEVDKKVRGQMYFEQICLHILRTS